MADLFDHAPKPTMAGVSGVNFWADGRSVIGVEYRDVHAFFRWVSVTRPHWDFDSHTISRPWAGVPYPEALDLLEKGWPEGCKRMLDRVEALVPPARPSLVPSLAHDVAGAYPDVPAFCAGQPDYMVTRMEMEAGSSPVITIHTNSAASASVSTDTIEAYGAAVLTHVRNLEAAGYSVRLVLNETVKGGPFSLVHTSVPIKEAGAPLDIDRAAFMLIHPSMLRRLLFASKEYDLRQKPLGGGYGTPHKVPQDRRVVGEVYFSSIREIDRNNPLTSEEYYNRLAQDIVRDRPDLALLDDAA